MATLQCSGLKASAFRESPSPIFSFIVHEKCAPIAARTMLTSARCTQYPCVRYLASMLISDSGTQQINIHTGGLALQYLLECRAFISVLRSFLLLVAANKVEIEAQALVSAALTVTQEKRLKILFLFRHL
jgi:hypothetical protein